MSRVRIEAGFRVRAGTAQLSVRYPSGGSVVSAPIAPGLYQRAADLAAAMQDTLHALTDGDVFCEATATGYHIWSAGSAFDLSIADSALCAHTGLPDETLDALEVSGTSPAVWEGRYPALADGLTWRRATKTTARPGSRTTSALLSQARSWALKLTLDSAEVAGLRTVLSLGARGLPVTWWRNPSVALPWSWSQLEGYTVARVGPEYADEWLTRPHQTVLRVGLELEEWTL